MKKILILMLMLGLLLSCNDDFLERYPENSISKEAFFNTATDLELYTNGFYGGIGSSYDDIGTDNISTREAKDATWDLLRAAVSDLTQDGWSKDSWSALRSINFFLENSNAPNATEAEVKHYQAIAKFFRAQFYIDKVNTFSDVPWLNKALDVTDEEYLYAPKDTRGLVVDSIIKDMKFAVDHLSLSNGSKTRVSKWAALASLARFSLHEGTFRKYGMKNAAEAAYLTSKSASEYTYLLEIARDASQQLMDEGGFSLHGDYTELFTSNSLEGNSEIILYDDYENDKREHNAFTRLEWQYGTSQNLLDTYLKLDGTPYTLEELKTLEFRDSFSNRDPRAAQTINSPGWRMPGSESDYVGKLPFGGLGQVKFTPLDEDGWSWGASYNDLPIFRYAEVLLINAEAHSELGTLTNTILDNTVNAIRSRAGITGNLTTSAPVDPLLDARYPNIDVANKGAALEIRRERRVELACEGRRYADIIRWHVGDAIFTTDGKPENLQRGMYVPKMTVQPDGATYTLIEVTGDNEPDVIVAATAGDLATASNSHPGLSQISLDENIALTNGDEGHIIFDREVDVPGTFVEPKYYYRPIPQSAVLLNENLVQHELWSN
ncbi:Starch-binding associating with outer membrane [Arenibacter nanhaiticus]|uniref:Starch-binding associating with outer membrane n=1 Tax=Arenibacter nanhaiticus TaxID=558155 RepID=A0A1M6FBZ8_9FLAO|nr:RagB/SusD family nutrient uptake outer membrane protein [Arenibacter nanhaiticus]SHI95284.1 Starch-binding associating with outer membrane [Arenibacter nanhaiticus]